MDQAGMIENDIHEFYIRLADATTHEDIDKVVRQYCALVFTDPLMMEKVKERRFKVENKPSDEDNRND